MPKPMFGGTRMCGPCPSRGNICGPVDRDNTELVVAVLPRFTEGGVAAVQAEAFFQDRDGAHSNSVHLDTTFEKPVGPDEVAAALDPAALGQFFVRRFAHCENPGVLVTASQIPDARGGTGRLVSVEPWCPAMNDETFQLATRGPAIRLTASTTVVVPIQAIVLPAAGPSAGPQTAH